MLFGDDHLKSAYFNIYFYHKAMALPDLTLSLQFARFDGVAEHRAALPRQKVMRWLRHALADDGEFTVRIVDAEEGQSLNRDYRGKDYATNVLGHAVEAGELQGEGEVGQGHASEGLSGLERLRHQSPEQGLSHSLYACSLQLAPAKRVSV